MSVSVLGSRRASLLIVGVCAVVLSTCRGGERAGHDLFDSFETGVFIADSGFWRVGQMPGRPDLTDAQKWTLHPLVPSEGWEWPGRVGWHPIGPRAVLAGPNRWSESAEPLRLELEWHRREGLAGVQHVGVSVNDIGVGETELGADRLVQSVVVPEAALQAERLEIGLEFSPPLARGEDRLFAVSLSGFGLVVGEAEPAQQEAGFLIDAEDRVVRIVRDGSVVVGVGQLPGFDSLVWEVRCRGVASSLTVTVSGALSAPALGSDVSECGRSWRQRELSLPTDAERHLTVRFSGEVGEDRGVIEIRRLRLEGSEGGPMPSAGDRPASPDASPTRPPDILLVVLDAARAGHFGFSGYHRDTTPNLDRLAEESLVFEQAYSECATTSCSIPNLISGVPFLGVGTVFEGRRIPDEIVTLAEYLEPLDYRSVGLSANPNNSGRRNSHQGFDFFRKVPGTPRLNTLALEAIRDQPADQPLFLQLHYLPPHHPYNPPPGFDIFTDPAYAGPVHPKIGLDPYTMGIRTFSEADRQQLIGLYDGLLRWVDHNVSKVLDAMKDVRRWENTVVIVTSDHGEAFGEHGHFSHNSTLFEEMLQVPLLVRLPGGRQPDVDTRRPVLLGDIVPTLLAYLGLSPRAEVGGVDLLEQRKGRGDVRPLFFRTYHQGRPFLGVRLGPWKLIDSSRFRAPMLFDLDADPGETRNLYAGRPFVFAGLAVRLRQFLQRMEAREIEPGAEIELSPDEIEELKALGYVE